MYKVHKVIKRDGIFLLCFFLVVEYIWGKNNRELEEMLVKLRFIPRLVREARSRVHKF